MNVCQSMFKNDSTISAGNKAELGANWIHGVLGNPLYELAVSKGLVSVPRFR